MHPRPVLPLSLALVLSALIFCARPAAAQPVPQICDDAVNYGKTENPDLNRVLEMETACLQHDLCQQNRGEALSNRCGTYMALGQLQAALQDCNEAIRLHPHSAAYNNLGTVYNRMEQYQRAIEQYDTAIRMAPKNYTAYVGRAGAYMKMGDFRACAQGLDELKNKQVGGINMEILRGHCHEQLGEMEEAAECYRYVAVYHLHDDSATAVQWCNNSLELNPDNGEVYELRGHAYQDLGQLQQTIQDYEMAISKGFKQSGRYLAWLLATSKDPSVLDGSRAVEIAEGMIQGGKEEYISYELLDILAAAYARNGQFDKAVATQQRVLEKIKPGYMTDEGLREYQGRLYLYQQGHVYTDQ